MNRLSNKVAVVTGSASGIGRSTARLFAREGAKVAVVDIDSRRTEEVAGEIIQEGGNALAVPCNVSDEREVASAVAKIISNFGRIDILFNNAGILHVKELEDTTVEEWDRVMAINAKGVFLWAKHVVPIMKKNGGGSIVNAGSSAALTGNLTMTAYTASKGAVVALTRAMALDLAKYNIRVNATCPGAIFTPMLQLEAKSLGKTLDQALNDWKAGAPLGRIGTTEEMATAVLYLASDDASFVTGSVLSVDGGLTSV